MKNLHWYLVRSSVVYFEQGILECDILLEILARKLNLVVFAISIGTHDGPISNRDRNAKKQDHCPICVETSIVKKGKPLFQEIRHTKDKRGEDEVAEGAIAFSKALQGGVFYGRDARNTNAGRHGERWEEKQRLRRCFIEFLRAVWPCLSWPARPCTLGRGCSGCSLQEATMFPTTRTEGSLRKARFRHAQAILGQELHLRLSSVKVLLVGAGGLGCELRMHRRVSVASVF